MRNDDRRIIQVKVIDNRVDPADLNRCLQQLSEAIYSIEGRKGPVELRDSLRVIADKDRTIFQGTATDGPSSRFSVASLGLNGEEIEIGQGTRYDGDTRYATVPAPSSLRFGPGTVHIQADFGLEVGQAFVPTVIETWTAP